MGQKGRRLKTAQRGGVNAEFLLQLTPGSVGWMLVGFDVSAGRQPQPGADVVHQQAAAVVGVDHDDVGDEVRVWGRRLASAEDVIGVLEPTQRVRLMLGLEVVPGSRTATRRCTAVTDERIGRRARSQALLGSRPA